MQLPQVLVTVANNMQKVYDAGFKEGRETFWGMFWDTFQNFGLRNQYSYAFGYGWDDDNFAPKYMIAPIEDSTPIAVATQTADHMFYMSNISYIDEKQVDLSRVEKFDYTFANSGFVSISIDAGNAERMIRTFSNTPYLTDLTIKNIPEKCTFTNTELFYRNVSLMNVHLSGTIGNDISFHDSPILSKESIINIVNTLSTSATGKTLELSVYAVSRAFETEDRKKDGGTSDEWAALKATRPNWTITLIDGMPPYEW